MSNQTQTYKTLRETAEHFNVHPNTARRLIRDGELRAIRIHGHFRVPVDAIAELEQRSAVERTS